MGELSGIQEPTNKVGQAGVRVVEESSNRVMQKHREQNLSKWGRIVTGNGWNFGVELDLVRCGDGKDDGVGKIKESWKIMEQKKNNKVRKSMEQEIKGVGVWNRIYLRKKRIKIGKKAEYRGKKSE